VSNRRHSKIGHFPGGRGQKADAGRGHGFPGFQGSGDGDFGDDLGFVAWDKEILAAMKLGTDQADKTVAQELTPAHMAQDIDTEMDIDNKMSMQTAKTIPQEPISASVEETPLATTEPIGYEELPALASAVLRVSESITPGPEMTVTSDLPDLLIPPVQLDPTVLTGEGESPDSLGWAGSAVGSPELGD
jgi:hypothetical protein